jgi:hypothetical protein
MGKLITVVTENYLQVGKLILSQKNWFMIEGLKNFLAEMGQGKNDMTKKRD